MAVKQIDRHKKLYYRYVLQESQFQKNMIQQEESDNRKLSLVVRSLERNMLTKCEKFKIKSKAKGQEITL